MPKKLHKSIKTYFSKLKKMPTFNLPSPPTTHSILSACKYPKTPSFAATDRRHPEDPTDDNPVDPASAATLADVDRFLFENFHSLYLSDDVEDINAHGVSPSTATARITADVIKPSDRFFVVSPGTSSSLAVDDARTSATSTPSSLMRSSSSSVPGDSVAVMTLSADPYVDFLRSMHAMVDSRRVDPSQPLDWDFMEELLICYLELNDRKVHKHILKAFTDLTVSLRRKISTERKKGPTTTTARRRRKIRKAPQKHLDELAPQEKVKDVYYDGKYM